MTAGGLGFDGPVGGARWAGRGGRYQRMNLGSGNTIRSEARGRLRVVLPCLVRDFQPGLPTRSQNSSRIADGEETVTGKRMADCGARGRAWTGRGAALSTFSSTAPEKCLKYLTDRLISLCPTVTESG